jgi:hypothetical protein
MSRPKTRPVGAAGLLSRYRDGTCTHTCQHCQHWQQWPRWAPAVRFARRHDAAHHANAIRYHRGPREDRDLATRRSGGNPLLGRLAVAVLALLLFALTANAVASHAAPAPPARSIAIIPTTTSPPTATPERSMPTPAGPPATNTTGKWTPTSDQPPTPASSPVGGGR